MMIMMLMMLCWAIELFEFGYRFCNSPNDITTDLVGGIVEVDVLIC